MWGFVYGGFRFEVFGFVKKGCQVLGVYLDPPTKTLG